MQFYWRVLCVVVFIMLQFLCLVFSLFFFFFFFSSRRRHTRCREVSWARRCVQETVQSFFVFLFKYFDIFAAFFTGICVYTVLCYFINNPPVSYTHLTLPTILLVQISVVAVSLKKKKTRRSRTREQKNKE
eukprot:TRINITY_DN16228_c0_g2_i1.p1 TRINITY_DN16228_c0_g2~~TRINITY_DN16228_c0_g2_i1.p1  ORF type:complete len:131 (+),score=48.89 TRINITY_DN16228_c0_g2_i1:3-395(+)